jgi:propionyl-CoA carboxylase alpha chain
MYYDPMISKLIAWGKDRKEAHELIDKAFDEYVIQGVTHNIGFGKSIIHNESYMAGDYSTAFIPKFYPNGYSGNVLTNKDMEVLALACHKMKNINAGYHKEDLVQRNEIHNSVVYVSIFGKGDVGDRDWKVEMNESEYKITDMASGKSTISNLKNFSFVHNSLIRFGLNEGEHTLQFMGSTNDLRFDFYYQGGKINTMIYDEVQYKYNKHMKPHPKADYSKSVISHMPGAVLSVSVVVG